MVVTAPAGWERVKGFMRRIACTRAGERGDWRGSAVGPDTSVLGGLGFQNPVGGEGSVERHLP